MQYVRSISGSVSKTWNSINPATLSGAIDVIVVEQEDGSLACSPFHVRFGKFSLLRPYEKKVEFSVNNVKQDYAMKLGEEGEAFFVFETSDSIPLSMQTSPLVSPATSPSFPAESPGAASLSEPDFLDLDPVNGKPRSGSVNARPSSRGISYSSPLLRKPDQLTSLTPLSSSPPDSSGRSMSGDWSAMARTGRPNRDELLSIRTRTRSGTDLSDPDVQDHRSVTLTLGPGDKTDDITRRSNSPPPLPTKEAIERAMTLSSRLSASNIPSQVTDTGDLMLDMTGYKSSEEDALRAEIIARKILSEELEGNYDIGALIGADELGNLWIYSSEEAKEAATNRVASLNGIANQPVITADTISDPGYHSDTDSDHIPPPLAPIHRRADSEGANNIGLQTPPKTPPGDSSAGDPNRNYAKTLRLTSDQLKALNLKAGPNPMSFTVNRATCQAFMYLWRYDVPVVISDIDGTITKSDALGQVLNMIGRDWTHIGVAKLYTDIVNNGYNIMYLTSRSVGQADMTRAYLNGVVQENYRLPKGPTIMSPDRTIAALRREIYIRKPEVFKMACLRDIKSLFGPNKSPFYAGFGNRLTDALSYRSVSIPSNRIFTINSNAEVSLDLLSLNKLRLSYVNMREVVDHYFPPVNTLVKGGGAEYTDFTYWREPVLDIEEFSDSDNEERGGKDNESEDEGEDEEEDEDEDEEDINDELGESYISRDSMDDQGEPELGDSMIISTSQDYDEEEFEDDPSNSLVEGAILLEDDGNETVGAESDNEDDEGATRPDSTRSNSDQNKTVSEDLDAEIITGTKGLGLERK
ncbi:Phosphatidate phosphatase/4-nitrophenylphosphatase, partial [Scytalidium lignicola]